MSKYIAQMKYYDIIKYQEERNRQLLNLELIMKDGENKGASFKEVLFGSEVEALKVLFINKQTKKVGSIIYTDFDVALEGKNLRLAEEKSSFRKFMCKMFCVKRPLHFKSFDCIDLMGKQKEVQYYLDQGCPKAVSGTPNDRLDSDIKARQIGDYKADCAKYDAVRTSKLKNFDEGTSTSSSVSTKCSETKVFV